MQPRNLSWQSCYKRMKLMLAGFCGILIFSAFFSPKQVESKVFHIPAQTFDAWKEMGTTWHDTITIDSFSISPLVTLGEYKVYLEEMKRDSGYAFYLTQLPDSDMCATDAYIKYMNTPEYDPFPVSGVTWVSAVNYCQWKTKKNNLGDSIKVIYRLPMMGEWLAAYRYLNNNKIAHDFNRNYSDWLMEAMDESIYDFTPDKKGAFYRVSYVYHDLPDDLPVLRRKRLIGNSFHAQSERLADSFANYAYSYEGYAYIGFRVVEARPEIRGSEEWNWMLAKPKKPLKK